MDKVCAINDLELLECEIDAKYKEKILKEHKEKSKASKIKHNVKGELNTWQDSSFSFVAGYTSGGIPYGITWEECGSNIEEENDDIHEGDGDGPF